MSVAAQHRWLMSLTDITTAQRGPTYIMSTKEGMPRLLGGTYPLDLQPFADKLPTIKDLTAEVAFQLTSLIA